MCCPKSLNTRPWAVACAYTTLLIFMTMFLLFVPFVFHPGVFDSYFAMMESNGMQYNVQMEAMTSQMYGMLCFLCFGSLFVALMALLCIVGIHKERSGFVIPYLVVKSILALLVVGGSFFAFSSVRATDQYGAFDDSQAQVWSVGKAAFILMVLVLYWVFITPIVVVSSHLHRIMNGTATSYSRAPLIAMEVPPAHEVPPYDYAIKSAGSV